MVTLRSGTKLVVASHNKGKVWEINQLIAPYGLEAVPAADLGLAEPEETETTFRGNALIKAKAAADASGLPALADDSGLEIDALDGAPGVYSADWSMPGRDFGRAMTRVHDALEKKGAWGGAAAPKANFISVLCLASPGGAHQFFEGKVFGSLVWPPRGGNGFGYDPMFVPDGASQTFGEMEPKSKYAISHRTRAFDAFRRECLGDKSESPMSPNADRDAAGLHAAAANISTRDELKTFVKLLGDDLRKRGREGVDLGTLLGALEATASAQGSSDEPRWRTLAKALLKATAEPKAS